MFKRVSVDKIGIDALFEEPVVILIDDEKKNFLVMRIGPFEAMAIALAMEDVKIDRPLTHDLMVNILTSLDVKLMKVIIDDLRNGVYYAKLILKKDDQLLEVDARPSDSIALAMRVKAPIYVRENLLMPLSKEMFKEMFRETKEEEESRKPDSLVSSEFNVSEMPLIEEDEEKRRFREFLENLKPSDFLKDMDT